MLMGAKSVSYGATPVEAAQAFLAENVGMFLPGSLGKTKDEKINLKVSSSKALPGSTVVEFGQEYQGIPVYGAFLVVMVDSYGRIVHVTSTTDPRVTFSTTPTTFQQVDNAFRSTQASQSIPVTAISNTLVIFPGDIPRLAYQVLYNIGDPSEPWEYVLDAENGLILKSKRLVKDQGKKRPNEAAIGQQTQRIQNEDDQKLGQKNTSDNPLAIYKVHVDLRTGNTTTKKSDESGEKLYSNTGVPDYSTSPQASEKRRTIEK
jgi:Zn-dependent metalloprotease